MREPLDTTDCREALGLWPLLLCFDPGDQGGERPMVRKAVGQVGLVEALLPAAFGSNQRLERIRVQDDWQPIDALLQPMRRALTGRPAYPIGISKKR